MLIEGEIAHAHWTRVGYYESARVEKSAVHVEPNTHIIIVSIGRNDRSCRGEVEVGFPDVVRELPPHRHSAVVAEHVATLAEVEAVDVAVDLMPRRNQSRVLPRRLNTIHTHNLQHMQKICKHAIAVIITNFKEIFR